MKNKLKAGNKIISQSIGLTHLKRIRYLQKSLFKSVIFIHTLVLVFLCSCTPKNMDTDLTANHLRGKVKSVRSVLYTLKGNPDSINSWNDTALEPFISSCEMESYLEFDENGHLIEKSEKYFNLPIFNKETYTYNENGRMIDGKQYDCEGCKPCKIKFEYDIRGFLIGKIFYNPAEIKTSETIYIYNWLGKLTEIDNLESGELPSIRFLYNSSGDLVKEEWYNSEAEPKNNSNILLYVIYEHSKDRKLEDAFYHDNNGFNYLTISEKFDKNGNLISSFSFYPDGSVLGASKYRFDIDDSGNYIKRIISYSDKPGSYTKREIEYYVNNTTDGNKINK